MAATSGPSTSLMFMQFMPTANRFCDSTNHDRTAPNKQNFYCRNRSIKTIMNSRPDFTSSTQNPLPSNTNTNPVITYSQPAPQTIFIVMDISTHTLTDPVIAQLFCFYQNESQINLDKRDSTLSSSFITSRGWFASILKRPRIEFM